jgi:capsid protein
MYADFVKANLRGVASGLGVAYHALANDLEGVSFSSIRSGTLEERDAWMLIQEWFSQSFLDRVHAEWLQSALAFGQIALPNGSTLPITKLDKFSAARLAAAAAGSGWTRSRTSRPTSPPSTPA